MISETDFRREVRFCIPFTLLCIGYDGSLLSQDIIELDNVHVFVNDILYSTEYDMYIMQGSEDYTRLNIKPKGSNKSFCSISKNGINDFKYMFEEKYGGGCIDTLLYKNYLLYCYGNKTINVIDINTFNLIKSIALDRTITKMQYDPSRNALYVSTGRSCKMIEDILQ